MPKTFINTLLLLIFFSFYGLKASTLSSCLIDGVSPVEQIMKKKKWLRLTKDVSKELLFTTFDMQHINVSTKNITELSKSVTILGQDLQFKGEISVNPLALNGEVLAKYSATMNDGNFNLAHLKIQKLNVDICMMRKAGKTEIYSAFTASIKRKKRSYKVKLFLQKSKKGEVIIMRAGDLTLSEMLPIVKKIEYLKDFKLNDIRVSKKAISYEGELNGHNFSLKSLKNGKDRLEFGPSFLSIHDILPETKKLSYLNDFVLKKVEQHGFDIALLGSVGKSSFTIQSNIEHLNSFFIDSKAISLASIFSLGHQQAYLKAFKIAHVSYNEGHITLDGDIVSRPLSLDINTEKPEHFLVKGDSLQLSDILPQTKTMAYFNSFILNHLEHDNELLHLKGHVLHDEINIDVDLSKKESFEIAAKHLSPHVVLASLDKQKYLKDFKLDKILYDHGDFSLQGEIHDEKLNILLDTKRQGDFSIYSDELKLAKILPKSKEIPYLEDFSLESLHYVSNGLILKGTMDNQATNISVRNQDDFSVYINNIALGEMFPFTKELAYLRDFKADSLHYKKSQLEIKGALLKEHFSLSMDLNKNNNFTLNGNNLALKNIIPSSTKVPYLSTFKLKTLNYNDNALVLQGDVEGQMIALSVAKEMNKGFVLSGKIGLEKLLPHTKGRDYLKKFQLSSFTLNNKQIKVSGSMNAKAILITSSLSNKDSFKIKSDLFKLSELLPLSRKLAFFDNCKVKSLHQDKETIHLEANVLGKDVTLTATLNNEASIRFKETDFSLPELLPELASHTYLDSFNFKSFLLKNNTLGILGELHGEPIKINAQGSENKNFFIASDALKLTHILPWAKNLEYLEDFQTHSLSIKDKNTTLSGFIDGKAFSIKVENRHTQSLQMSGDNIKIQELYSQVKQYPLLKNFHINSMRLHSYKLELSGRINKRKAKFSMDIREPKSFTLQAKGLALKQIFSETVDIAALNNFVLERLDVNDKGIYAQGVVKHKRISLQRLRSSNNLELQMEGFLASDFYSSLKELPSVKELTVPRATLKDRRLTLHMDVLEKKFKIFSNDIKDDSLISLYFEDLPLSSFTPMSKADPLYKASFTDAMFVWVKGEMGSFKAESLPASLSKRLGMDSNDLFKFSKGLHLHGNLKVKTSKALARSLKALGMTEDALYLRGEVSTNSFSFMHPVKKRDDSKAVFLDKREFLSALSLSAWLGKVDVQTLPELFKDEEKFVFTLKGSTSGKKLEKEISFKAKLDGLNNSPAFICTLNINQDLDDKLHLIAKRETLWNNPFDIKKLTLKEVFFDISLEKDSMMKLYAYTDIGSKINIPVDAEVNYNGDGLFVESLDLKGRFELSDFPGSKQIPHASEFTLHQVELSKLGLHAHVYLEDTHSDAYLFNSSGWHFALHEKQMNLTDLLPLWKSDKSLKNFRLNDALILFSEKGLVLNMNKKTIITPILHNIGSDATKTIVLSDGVSLLAKFNAEDMGVIGQGLSKLGVTDDAVVWGELKGLFTKEKPALSLKISLPKLGQTQGLPNQFMSYDRSLGMASQKFYINYKGNNLDVGVEAHMKIEAIDDELSALTDIKINFDKDAIGIHFLASVSGLWSKPFGIIGMQLKKVTFDGVIDDKDALTMAIRGKQNYGSCENKDTLTSKCLKLEIKAEVKMNLQDELTQAVVFKAEAARLDTTRLLSITKSLAINANNIDKIKVPSFEITNASLAFASKDTSTYTKGFSFDGDIIFLNKNRGPIHGTSDSSGLYIKGPISDIKLDTILEFKNNYINIVLTDTPRFKMDSYIDLFGNEKKVKMNLENTYMSFDFLQNLGGLGDTDFHVNVEGLNLRKGSYSPMSTVSLEAIPKSNISVWLKSEIKKGIEVYLREIQEKMMEDKRLLKTSIENLQEIDHRIEQSRALMNKAATRASLRKSALKQRVAAVKERLDIQLYKIQHCGEKWEHWKCLLENETAVAATQSLYTQTKNKLVSIQDHEIVAYDLEVGLNSLLEKRDSMYINLNLARAKVIAGEKTYAFMEKNIDDIVNNKLSTLMLDVKQSRLSGELRDIIDKGAPLSLDMDFKLFDKDMKESFVLNMPDKAENIKFELNNFALLVALSFDAILNTNHLNIDSEVRIWMDAYLAEKIMYSESTIRKTLMLLPEKYQHLIKAYNKHNKLYQDAFTRLAHKQKRTVQDYRTSDMLAKSVEYIEDYIQVGHSGLCMGVSKNKKSLSQVNCMDKNVAKWSTKKVEDYVLIHNKGLCIQSSSNKKDIQLAGCKTSSKSMHWKIVSKDGLQQKIVNKVSQKCLDFSSTKNPALQILGQQRACSGKDSQSFLALNEVQRSSLHKVKVPIKSQNKNCIRTNKEHSKFYSSHCRDNDSKSLKLSFDFLQESNGDIRIMHSENGKCLLASKDDKLSLQTCDQGRDMWWNIKETSALAWELYSPYYKKCLSLPKSTKSSLKEIELESCDESKEQSFDLAW